MTARELRDSLRGIPDDAEVVIVREYVSADATHVDAYDFHFSLLSPSCAHPVIIQTSEFARIVDARLVDYECDDEDGGGRIVKTRKAGA